MRPGVCIRGEVLLYGALGSSRKGRWWEDSWEKIVDYSIGEMGGGCWL